jgi:predicted MFS family arabinose efflux permease
MNSPPSNHRNSSWAKLGWTTVILIALAAAVGQAFGRFGYGVLLPAVRDDLGISNTLAGLVGAANVGAYLLGTLMVAWATSRFLLINVMRVGLAFATLGLLIASLAGSPWVLAAGLFVAGIGGAFLWIPAPVIAADALPAHRRPLAVGLMSSGIGVGVMFVSILSGILRPIEGDSAWSSVYEIQFFIGVGVLIAVLLLVRHQQAAPSGGAGFGGFTALQRMPGWLPHIIAYSTFGFMYLLILGFLTTRLEDDGIWSSVDAAFAFTLVGFTMIFGGPTFVIIAQRIGVRLTLALAFALWPIFVGVILTGYELPVLAACVGIGFLFGAIPTLMTLYVVENTTAQDYGPSFAAATLAFGFAQTISPPIGGFIADLTGSFTFVFLLAAFMSIIGLFAALRLPRQDAQ